MKKIFLRGAIGVSLNEFMITNIKSILVFSCSELVRDILTGADFCMKEEFHQLLLLSINKEIAELKIELRENIGGVSFEVSHVIV